MRSNSVHVKSIAGALGAEIEGVDLGRDLDGDWIAVLRRVQLIRVLDCEIGPILSHMLSVSR